MRAGIDEAGRGPVFGPMVMAIVATDNEDALQTMGVKDSKDLAPEVRDRLARTILDLPHEIIELSPEEIDRAVEGDLDNLNKLEARTTALLIYKLASYQPFHEVIVDSPAKDGEKYGGVVRAELDKLDTKGITKKIKIVCEIKADANYPVVGAASILAKVTRDAVIKRIELDHGDIGSGYPSDPTTKQYLDRHWQEGHAFFRKSWQSYKRLAEKANQPSLQDFGEHAEEHASVVEEFEFLKDHGFSFVEPTNAYEVVRMKKDKTTIIRYTTGKIVVQGPEKTTVEKLLADHNS